MRPQRTVSAILTPRSGSRPFMLVALKDQSVSGAGTMVAVVVGHVEWVSFLCIARPIAPGAIALSEAALDEPAGGGAVAAIELARLAGRSVLVTALGHDAIGHA